MAEAYPAYCAKCLYCVYQTNSEEDFLKHLRVHNSEYNFKVPCMVCGGLTKSIELYRKHKKTCIGKKYLENQTEQQNKQQNEPESVTIFFWECLNCPEKIQIKAEPNFDDFDKVKTHLYKHSRNNELVQCPVKDPICEKSYTLYTSLNRLV